MPRLLQRIATANLVTALAAVACGEGRNVTAPTATAAQPGPGLSQLIDDLQARQVAVAIVELGSPSGLSVRPWLLDVNEERGRVQVFEYANAAALDADAARISPDGFRIGLTAVDWIGAPHFFRNARLIVNYVGCRGDVIALFEATVGPQFAGGGIPPILGDPCGP